MAKKRRLAKKTRIPDAKPHMIEMTKHDAGYDVVIESTTFTLPADSVIHTKAVAACSEYDSPDSKSVKILKRSSIELELVNETDVYENRIGVVLKASERDAKTLADDWDAYSDIMSALGEACSSIEDDRVEIVD
ncbi:hypothetical protein SH528x_003463 [Novipirellula sp. SH528]|uniref:hypothetical protein n=1 Tax=Novipirellula sp. SH528 TaxID=3454466 RepID=UPI003FA12254